MAQRMYRGMSVSSRTNSCRNRHRRPAKPGKSMMDSMALHQVQDEAMALLGVLRCRFTPWAWKASGQWLRTKRSLYAKKACCPTSPPTHMGGSSNNSCKTSLPSTTTLHATQPRSSRPSRSSHTIKARAPCAAYPHPKAPSSIPRSLPIPAPPPPPASPHPSQSSLGTPAPTLPRPRSHRPAAPSLCTLHPRRSRMPPARPRSCLRRSSTRQQPCLLGMAWRLYWALRPGM